MPSSVRPKGSGSGSRAAPVTPMSERQQMALLMQMTSGNNDVGSRSPSSSNARSRERNERGETPLHLAAIKGDVEQVCKLLAHRADPNAADFAGWTPLHEACNHGRYEVALRLVQSGASLNARGLDDDTPLHDAAANGHLKLARMLAERGADIRAKNAKGRTPVDVAPASMKPYLLDLSLPLPESTGSRLQPRSRDDKKITATGINSESTTSNKQKDETMDVKNSTTEDVYEFKATKDAASAEPSSDQKSAGESSQMDVVAVDPLGGSADASQNEDGSGSATPPTSKRAFSDVADATDEATPAVPGGSSQSGNDEESRRKKRKDDTVKEGKLNVQRNAGQSKSQTGKQSASAQSKSGSSGSAKGSTDKKSPCSSPKPTVSDAEVEDGKSDLKVPPLKIVIPQTNSNEQEAAGRNGKNSSQRTHPALPYVVASSTSGGGGSSDSSEKEPSTATTTAETTATASSAKADEKKETASAVSDERGGSSHQRVLRSSQRTGTDRGSNNCSPQLQRSRSPSLSEEASPPNNNNINHNNNNNRQADPPSSSAAHANATSKSSDIQTQPHSNETETSTTSCATSTVSTVTTASTSAAPVELHPRKRKMKQNKEQAAAAAAQQEPAENPAEAQVHPHEQPITNCYRLFLDIRNQIGKRRRGLFPVQPKPPQGFKDYLMNRCTYVLAGTAPTSPNINYPQNLPAAQMKDLFTDQEKERYRLRTQHVIEKEKLVLSVEQEILRVHGRAARALANQSLPFSVCTILRDEEVYNLITPEQEEKDRNARSRYNGRLFLSWLQDVDDKWEKIKEHMLLRHHNEAESLHAVQKMDWEWKMKELNLCDRKSTPKIEDTHVPMVHVSDDFDLLPA